MSIQFNVNNHKNVIHLFLHLVIIVLVPSKEEKKFSNLKYFCSALKEIFIFFNKVNYKNKFLLWQLRTFQGRFYKKN